MINAGVLMLQDRLLLLLVFVLALLLDSVTLADASVGVLDAVQLITATLRGEEELLCRMLVEVVFFGKGDA